MPHHAKRQSFFQTLVDNPAERLGVELKSWIRPHLKTAKAKIVRALFALRHNRDGGFLLIGFDDKTLRPIPTPYSDDRVREVYHPDVIQRMVSEYAYEPFEVYVWFQPRDGQLHPVICVEEGVTQPALTKKYLKGADGKHLVRKDAIYVRSLRANGTVSSCLITPGDWPALIDTFVRNRNRIIAPSDEIGPRDDASRIAAAWEEFTQTAQQLLLRKGHGVKRTFRGLGTTLKESGLITDEQSAAVRRLRELRNVAVHMSSNAIAPKDVEEAERLSRTLCHDFRHVS